MSTWRNSEDDDVVLCSINGESVIDGGNGVGGPDAGVIEGAPEGCGAGSPIGSSIERDIQAQGRRDKEYRYIEPQQERVWHQQLGLRLVFHRNF